jgi:hypothetical protein
MGNDGEESKASDQAAAANVASVALKLPPFTIKTPGSWFRRAETKFRLHGITVSTTMADHTLAALSETTIELIDPWLEDQPKQLEYKALKTYMLTRFSLPPSERAQRVLQLADRPLGDDKPHERWEEIHSFLRLPPKDGRVQRVSLEREIFLKCLPKEVRQGLPKAHEMDEEDLLAMTEDLLDAYKANSRQATAFEVSCPDTEVHAAISNPRRQSSDRQPLASSACS